MMSPSAIKFPSFALAQEQQNFTANLVGQDVVPPTNSKATGTSEFTPSSDGMSMNYEVYVTDIDGVTLAQIYQGQEDGNGPAFINTHTLQRYNSERSSEWAVNPRRYNIDDLQGPLIGKQVSDLTELMENNNTYVEIQTTENPNGEIRGQIIK